MAKPQKRSERKINLLDFVDTSAALPQAPSAAPGSAPSSGSSYLRRDEPGEGGGWRSGPRSTDTSTEGEAGGSFRRGGGLRREEPLPPAASDEDFQWRKKQPEAAPIVRGSLRTSQPADVPAEPSAAEQDSNWRKAQKPVEPAVAVPTVVPVEPSQAEQDTNWRKAQPTPAPTAAPAPVVREKSEVDTSGSWRKPKEETTVEPAPLRRGGLRQDDSWRASKEEEDFKFKSDSSWRSDKKDAEPAPTSSKFAAFSKREPSLRQETSAEDAAPSKPFLRRGGGDEFPSAFRSKELAPQRDMSFRQENDFPSSFRKPLRIAPIDPVNTTTARPPKEDFPAAFQGGGLRRNAPDPTFRREDYSAFQGSFRDRSSNRDEGSFRDRNSNRDEGSFRAFGGGDRNRDEGSFRNRDEGSFRAFGGGDRNRDEGSFRAFGGGDRAREGGGSFRSRQDDASFGAFRSGGGGKPEFSRGSSRFEENTPLPTAPASVVAANAAAAAATPAVAMPAVAAPAVAKQKKSLEQCAVTIGPMLRDYMVDEDRAAAMKNISAVLADTDAGAEYIAKVTEQVALQETAVNNEVKLVLHKLVLRLLTDISKLDLQAFCEGLCLAYDADAAKAKMVFADLSIAPYLPELAKEQFRVPFVPAQASNEEEDNVSESKEIKLLRQILASADLSGDEEITWVKSNSSKLAKLYSAPKQERIQAVLLVEDAFHKVNFTPRGRIEEAFQALLDVCVLSPEAFIDWRDDPALMDKPTPGRERALFQTTGFFLDLEEEDEEDEEDEDEDYE